MNGLLVVGAGIAAYKMSKASTGKTDRVGEPNVVLDFITTDETSDVMSKMAGCFKNITEKELYNNRGFSSLFGQTGETRKANTNRYLINNDQANKTGALNAESKKKLLNQADKAVQYSRQAEHLFCQIANPANNQPNLIQAKIHCEDLLYLYAQRDELVLAALDESSRSGPDKIAICNQNQENLTIINARIERAQSGFREKLNLHLNQGNLSKHGYKEFLAQFQLLGTQTAQSKSKYQIEDFIRFYAFKVKLMQGNDATRKLVYDDFRKYIFSTSVGYLDAGEKLAYQYGRLIKDLLDESSLGDIDSQSGNLSQRFMQTVYNLLNVGQENFSLDCLCIGKENQARTDGVESLDGFPVGAGSYYLEAEGEEIVKNIVGYYSELSNINVIRNGKVEGLIPKLDLTRETTLLWNLVGGTNLEREKTKKGIFYRIDEQLKGFTSKTEKEMYSKLIGLENRENFWTASPLEKFINTLPQNPYSAVANPQATFEYAYTPNRIADSKRLNSLHNIATRCKLNGLGFPAQQNAAKKTQLHSLVSNYEILVAQDPELKTKYEAYFKTILGDTLHAAFLVFKNALVVQPNFAKPLDPVFSSGWKDVEDGLANACLQSAINRKAMARKQSFNMVLRNDYDVNTHLNTYASTTTALKEKLTQSSNCQDMKEIITSLGKLKNLVKFYNDIKDKERESNEIGLLAPPTEVVSLAELAVLKTKKDIFRLYTEFKRLESIYETNNPPLHPGNFNKMEREIFEYSLLKSLFNFLEEPGKAKNFGEQNIEVQPLLDEAVDFCIERLNRMQYIGLATDTINALNSKRLLLQLTKQKDMLIQFATVFSKASTEVNAKNELTNFANSMRSVIADLEDEYKELVKDNKNGERNKLFNDSCSKLNDWLLALFLNEGDKNVSNEYRYAHGKFHITLDQDIAESCQKNYSELHKASFTSEDWGKVSQVQRAMWETLLNTDDPMLPKMKLYLGQLFSDGFTYNPDMNDIPRFQQLLANYETVVVDNLVALNTIGYLHQEQLGHYDQLIGGIDNLSTFNTTVALRRKLLMGFFSYKADASSGKKFDCELTDDEKKLYLTVLYQSNLYSNARSGNTKIPEISEEESRNPDISKFALHAPHVFADPAEVVRQLLENLNTGYLNAADDDRNVVMDAALTNYADGTATMIADIERKSELLLRKLAEQSDAINELKKGLNLVGTKLASTTLQVTQDTINRCDELLGYFKVVPKESNTIIEKAKATLENAKTTLEKPLQLPEDIYTSVFGIPDNPELNVIQVDTLQLAEAYEEVFNKLVVNFRDLNNAHESAKIIEEFGAAYGEIRKVGLRSEIALFKNVTKAQTLDPAVSFNLEEKIINAIKKAKYTTSLSSITEPLDSKTLKQVYADCSTDSDEERKQIQAYLNAFQYRKIEQCLANFYIGASINLPKLTTNLRGLFELARPKNLSRAFISESPNDIEQRRKLIKDSDTYFNNLARSVTEWKSLLLENSKYAWLIQPQYEQFEADRRRYFDWFAKTYLKLGIVNSEKDGPFRDELQFGIILDYLRVYEALSAEKIDQKQIDLIERFYRTPDLIQQGELENIQKALNGINEFLGRVAPDPSFIKDLVAGLKTLLNHLMHKLVYTKDNTSVETIQHKLQELYNRFYLTIIEKGNKTLGEIEKQNNQLNRIMETFKAIRATPVFADLAEQFQNVQNVGELEKIFINNADRFREAEESVESYLEMLRLVIYGIKITSKDTGIKNFDINSVAELIRDQNALLVIEPNGQILEDAGSDSTNSTLAATTQIGIRLKDPDPLKVKAEDSI